MRADVGSSFIVVGGETFKLAGSGARKTDVPRKRSEGRFRSVFNAGRCPAYFPRHGGGPTFEGSESSPLCPRNSFCFWRMLQASAVSAGMLWGKEGCIRGGNVDRNGVPGRWRDDLPCAPTPMLEATARRMRTYRVPLTRREFLLSDTADKQRQGGTDLVPNVQRATVLQAQNAKRRPAYLRQDGV